MQISNDSTVKAHSKAVVSLKYSPDGQFIAAASADRKLSLINASAGTLIRTFDGGHMNGLNDCVWVSDKLIATASDDQTVKLWDIEEDKPITTFKGNKSFIYSLAVDVNNGLIVSGSFNGYVNAFHSSLRDPVLSFAAHSEPIVSLEFSPLNNHQYLTAAQDGLIRTWEGSACISTLVVSTGQATALSGAMHLSSTGKYLMVSSLDSTHRLYYNPSLFAHLAVANPIDVLHKELEREQVGVPLRSYTGHINTKYSLQSGVIYTNQQDLLISGSEYEYMHIWDVGAGGGPIFSFESGQGLVHAVACSPLNIADNYSVSKGGSNVQSGHEIDGNECVDTSLSCSVVNSRSDGDSGSGSGPSAHQRFATGGKDGSVKLWSATATATSTI